MGGVILFYLACLALGAALSKNRPAAIAVVTVGYILALVDFLTKQLLEAHVSYFILSRLDLTMFQMAPVVVPVYFYGGIALTVLILYGQYRLINNMKKRSMKTRTRVILGILAILILTFSTTTKAIVGTCTTAANIHRYQVMTLDEVKSSLNMEGYTGRSEVTAKAGKNLVVIYLESLENNFLDEEKFPLELANLHRFQQEGWHTYGNYICAYGSGWTTGGLYSTQTGLPAMFGGNRGIFLMESNTQAVTYASVLKQAGYQNVFLSNSNLSFAGTGAMMRSLGYQTFGGEDFDPQIPRTRWGPHDAQVFSKAKEEYIRLSANGEPFHIAILTIDTHYPDGFPDPAMRGYVDERIPSDSHEYVVATLDYLVGDFVRFIEAQPNGKDTVIVLMNDHLMMHKKDRASIVDKLKHKKRSNLLIVNRPIEGFAPTDEIAFWNIPPIILDLAQVEHNAKFPIDHVPQMSEQYIKDNEEIFTIFNMKLLY